MRNLVHNFVIIYLLKNEKIRTTFFFSLIRAILMVGAGLFIPYVIYKELNLYYVIFYQFLLAGLLRFIPIILLKPILKRGIEFAYLLSILAFITQLFIIKFFQLTPITIIIIAFFASISISIYWFSLNLSTALFSDKNKENEERTLIVMTVSILKIVLPFIASILIYYMGGQNYFFLLAVLSLAFTFLLVINLKKSKKINKVEINFRIKKEYLKYFPLFFFEASFIVLIFIFYLILITQTMNIENLGLILTLTNLITIIITLFLAKRIDKIKDFDFMLVGFLLLIPLYLHVYFLNLSTIVKIAYLINGTLISIITTSYFGFLLSLIKKDKEILFFRELSLALSFTLIYGIILLFNLNIWLVFYVLTLIQILFAIFYHFKVKILEIEEIKNNSDCCENLEKIKKKLNKLK